MYDVVCAGFTCLDIPVIGDIGKAVFDVDSTHVDSISMTAGGDAVNEAITCASLGMKTAIVSYVGDDNGGQVIIDALSAKGVDTSGVEIIAGQSTQTAVPLIDRTGQRHFLFNSGCSPEYTGMNIDFDAYMSAGILIIGSFFVAEQFDRMGVPLLLKKARENGVTTIADTCSDVMGLGLSHIAEPLKYLDYFMPSLEEAEDLSGEKEYSKIASVFMDMGAGCVVLKLGAEGAFVKTADKEFVVPAFDNIKVLDTTGCGDNFVAGFACGLHNRFSIKDSIRFASAVAGINAGFVGGSGGLESINVVRDFLNQRDIEIAAE